MSTQLEDTTQASSDEIFRQKPFNILAEQMVLGSLLANNDQINKIADLLNSDDFFEPIHKKIYEVILSHTDKNILANPITLKYQFDSEPGLEQYGGSQYLAKLAALGSSIINIQDYAKTVLDLSIKRKLIAIGEDVVNNAYDKDLEVTAYGQIELAEQSLFNLAVHGLDQNTNAKHLKSSLVTTVNKLQNAFKTQEMVTGITTGYTDIDTLLGGMQQSDLLIIAGRPSMGKTALAVNFAINACKSLRDNGAKLAEPQSVGFFSLEMSSDQLAMRLLAMLSEVDASMLRIGKIDEEQFTKILYANTELYQMPLYIDDTPALTISALRTRARRMKRKHNVGLIVVDYLQLLRGSAKSSAENRVIEISEITQGLKAIAKELNIPVIALSQLSRAVEQREDKRPLLSDLRESGSIEQDADIVMFIFREEYYLMRKKPQDGSEDFEKWHQKIDHVANMAEVIVAKHRNGPIGTVRLHYNNRTTKFSNLYKVAT